jgi:hypothetical protein
MGSWYVMTHTIGLLAHSQPFPGPSTGCKMLLPRSCVRALLDIKRSLICLAAYSELFCHSGKVHN